MSSFEIEPGEFVVLAGALRLGQVDAAASDQRAGAALPRRRVRRRRGRSAGRDTREHGPGELAAVVGTLFQDPETQVVLGTPRAELAFAVENRGASAAEVARAVEETALALAIEPLLDRPTRRAQRRRAAARGARRDALLRGRLLVCLDEPTSQLDPVAGDELIGLLRRLNEDGDTAVMLAEHRLERCLAAADRVLAMDGGRLVFDGAPDRFLQWALSAAPALVTPGAKLLCAVSAAAGARRQARARVRCASAGLRA